MDVEDMAKLVASAWSLRWTAVFGPDEITLDECELWHLLEGRPEYEIERVWEWLEAKAIPIHQGMVFLHEHVVRGWSGYLERMESLSLRVQERLKNYFPKFGDYYEYVPPGARTTRPRS